jgi:hypothetical protein
MYISIHTQALRTKERDASDQLAMAEQRARSALADKSSLEETIRMLEESASSKVCLVFVYVCERERERESLCVCACLSVYAGRNYQDVGTERIV